MPIYEYKCAKCDFEFEAMQSMNDKPPEGCPQCKSPELDKLISTGIVGKVSGSNTPCPKQQGDIQKVDRETQEKPFWRKGEINNKILNNPERYIRTGQVD